MAKSNLSSDNLIDCPSDQLPANFVGAALYVEGGNPIHALIIIKHEATGVFEMFHYDGGTTVEFIQPGVLAPSFCGSLLHIVDEELIPTFITHCRIIKDEAKPRYGYFYNQGSLYDAEGKFISPNDMPEYMSCVGFCINVIQQYLSDESFFKYSDWDETTIGKDEGYIEQWIAKVKKHNPTVDEKLLREGLRRIFPLEYLTGAFSDELPVTKVFTDEESPKLKSIIEQRLKPASKVA